jgi:glycosyltransferase involved in cell wall biosynthesis
MGCEVEVITGTLGESGFNYTNYAVSDYVHTNAIVHLINLQSNHNLRLTHEENIYFFNCFKIIFDAFKPDIILNFGGDDLNYSIRNYARSNGVPVVFLLHNLLYNDAKIFSNADVIVVASQFAKDYYEERLKIFCTVISNFVDENSVLCDIKKPRFITFINPSTYKGVYVFAKIVDELGKVRPDIPFLVVESRANETNLVSCGIDLRYHNNVYMMSNTADSRHFWSVTKICLMPSLWLENQPLVAIEAMINGIPVIGSDRGGIPEVLGAAGVCLPIPSSYTPDSRCLPSSSEVARWIDCIILLWDNDHEYNNLSLKSLKQSRLFTSKEIPILYIKEFEKIISR